MKKKRVKNRPSLKILQVLKAIFKSCEKKTPPRKISTLRIKAPSLGMYATLGMYASQLHWWFQESVFTSFEHNLKAMESDLPIILRWYTAKVYEYQLAWA